MKTVQITIAALLMASMGSVFAAQADQTMLKDQERIGASGEKTHQLMEQKREQFKNEYRYQHRNQIMDGRGTRMQERRMSRTR